MPVVSTVSRRPPTECRRPTTLGVTPMRSTTPRPTIPPSTTSLFQAIWYGWSQSIEPRCSARGAQQLSHHTVGTTAGTIRSTIGIVRTATAGTAVGDGTTLIIGAGAIHTTLITTIHTTIHTITHTTTLHTQAREAWATQDITRFIARAP